MVDPFAGRMSRYLAEAEEWEERNRDADSEEPHPSSALIAGFKSGEMKVAGPVSAAMAIRRVLDLECIVGDEGAALMRATLAYLESA